VHREKIQVEEITGKQESGAEEEEEEKMCQEVGPSRAPTKGKGKQTVHRSPHKQPEVTLVLPCIPTGVQVLPDFLGCIDKLCYVDHDVKDRDKFP
jgi:hypothetical protein